MLTGEHVVLIKYLSARFLLTRATGFLEECQVYLYLRRRYHCKKNTVPGFLRWLVIHYRVPMVHLSESLLHYCITILRQEHNVAVLR